ncbi:hypothetical protein [Thioflexithrix psekupsensis]|uniref:DUF4156 domain-containing protein n=1 Tax=Thioflexithrix psekupsensis TaxID=1570016 RepID=A0A251XB68_9GAMM|nr:hypothetical protein [Thioflexithrix psekupsensis]OUD15682.1 hypothetical protein TPSD3_03980 [Thioflexithrix psekupsensis]
MRLKRNYLIFLTLFGILALASSACGKRDSLHPTQIRVAKSVDENVCAQVGHVSGAAPADVKQREGMRRALDEALYQAEILNASHIVVETHRYSSTEGTYVTAWAYRC